MKKDQIGTNAFEQAFVETWKKFTTDIERKRTKRNIQERNYLQLARR